MKVLYGTTNQAKLDAMRKTVEELGIKLVGLRDMDQSVPAAEETGKNPLENARMKARVYYRAFSMPVFSCDSGLYFDGLKETEQPGTHIRRIGGKELSDEEMIAYYAELAKMHGGRLTGRYRNAICFVVDDNTVFESMDESLATEPFVLVSEPHKKRVAGFPLDSLSIDIETGRYYHDITEKTLSKSCIEQGCRVFFERAIGKMTVEKCKKCNMISVDSE